jgi:ATP-dependent 26S proteasome regulatory subunit
VQLNKRKRQTSLYSRLRKHLGADPATLAVVERNFPIYHRANLQLAIEQVVVAVDTKFKLDGLVVGHEYDSVSLSKLAHPGIGREFPPGPVEYHDAELADGKSLACVKRGIYRFRTDAGPLAILVTQQPHSYPPQLLVEVMAPDRAQAQDVLRDLSVATERSPAFVGQVISLEMNCNRELAVRYHRLPQICAEQIVLPEAVLRRLNRHAVGFVRHAARLRDAGRHLKRGILLHGPPGTGKTLCAMHLAAQMPGRTVIILTGGGLSSIEVSGVMARALAPVTLILEDVDLIGTLREHQSVGANALLFELLNQMDGLAEDADILFVLTTNRPDVLEPALASRPGRIDQAIEIPLPDAQCRKRLLDLYARGIHLHLDDPQAVIQRTHGVSAAFIREMLRKAAILAAESDGHDVDTRGKLVVTQDHVNQAIDELLIAGGVITQRLLGVAPPAASS